MRTFRHCAALLLFISSLRGFADELPNADKVLAHAEAQAGEQQKAVLLVFGASWCKYCHLFEKFLASPEIQPILAKHFIIIHLGVYEELGKHPELNHPGSGKLVKRFGDADVGGLPFIVLLDAKGQMIVNSNRPSEKTSGGENIGYPSAPEEIDWFMVMIRKAVPALSEADAGTIERWLRKAAA